MKELTRITFDPDVMGGKPCIRGMRVQDIMPESLGPRVIQYIRPLGEPVSSLPVSSELSASEILAFPVYRQDTGEAVALDWQAYCTGHMKVVESYR